MRKRKERDIVVYKIINRLSGATYVGCTYNWKIRKAAHLANMNCGDISKTYSSTQWGFDFSFYGRPCFIIYVVKRFNRYRHTRALALERSLTRKLESRGIPMYNITNTTVFDNRVRGLSSKTIYSLGLSDSMNY